MAKSETREIADMLYRVHGKGVFNLAESAKILGVGKNRVKAYLEMEGVLVKKVGQQKVVTAYQLAEFMTAGRIAAIDTTSRGTVLGVEVNIPSGGMEGATA